MSGPTTSRRSIAAAVSGMSRVSRRRAQRGLGRLVEPDRERQLRIGPIGILQADRRVRRPDRGRGRRRRATRASRRGPSRGPARPRPSRVRPAQKSRWVSGSATSNSSRRLGERADGLPIDWLAHRTPRHSRANGSRDRSADGRGTPTPRLYSRREAGRRHRPQRRRRGSRRRAPRQGVPGNQAPQLGRVPQAVERDDHPGRRGRQHRRRPRRSSARRATRGPRS